MGARRGCECRDVQGYPAFEVSLNCGKVRRFACDSGRQLRVGDLMDAQAFFSQPGVGFFTMLLIGAIAGWIAERVTESDHGIFTNILVGIAGSFVGAKLAEIAQVPVFGFWRTLISAAIGAVLLLFAWRMIRGRR